MILAAILEGLQILDMATTEYALKTGVGEERNISMRKRKVRIPFYSVKLSTPFMIDWAGNYSLKRGYPIIKKITNGILLTFIGAQTIIGINNLWVIYSGKKGK